MISKLNQPLFATVKKQGITMSSTKCTLHHAVSFDLFSLLVSVILSFKSLCIAKYLLWVLSGLILL